MQALRPPIRYRARWVWLDQPAQWMPAVLEISGESISAIDTDLSTCDVDLGNVAVTPALCNAHTHLEFSSLLEPLRPLKPFSGWIPQVIGWRAQRSAPVASIIAQGLAESVGTGTTTIGEIATEGFTPEACTNFCGRVLAFRECLGLAETQVAAQLAAAQSHLTMVEHAPNITPGLSPHAPYSVHPELLSGLVALARERQVPVAMHLAESRDEIELLASGAGPLADLLNRLGVWQPHLFAEPQSPLDYLERLAPAPRVLVVHGNHFGAAEIDFLMRHPHMSVIYCPRTHATMGHPAHPWQAMLEAGINVAIGTDSRASNPDLSIVNELRFLKQSHPTVATSLLLSLATTNAASALGWGTTLGMIKPGLTADLAVWSLDGDAAHDPERHLLTSDCEIVGAMSRGEWCVTPPAMPGELSE